MSLRPYCILLHAEVRVSGLVVEPIIPPLLWTNLTEVTSMVMSAQMQSSWPRLWCILWVISRELNPYILWLDLHVTQIVHFLFYCYRCKAQSPSLSAMMWVLMVKICLIRHMTHSFAVLELSEILVNIFSRSSMLVITLSSKTGFNSSPTKILRPRTFWENFFI